MPYCPFCQPLRPLRDSLIGGYILLEKYHCMHILQIPWVVVKYLFMDNCTKSTNIILAPTCGSNISLSDIPLECPGTSTPHCLFWAMIIPIPKFTNSSTCHGARNLIFVITVQRLFCSFCFLFQHLKCPETEFTRLG